MGNDRNWPDLVLIDGGLGQLNAVLEALAGLGLGPEDVTLGILAPGIVEHHISAGGSYRVSDRDAIDFSVGYVLPHTVNGPEVTPFGVTPGSNIELNMHQVSVSVGWTRKF